MENEGKFPHYICSNETAVFEWNASSNSLLSKVVMKVFLWSLSFGTVLSATTAATPTTTAESADAFTTNININVQRESIGVFLVHRELHMQHISVLLNSLPILDDSIHHAANSHIF